MRTEIMVCFYNCVFYLFVFSRQLLRRFSEDGLTNSAGVPLGATGDTLAMRSFEGNLPVSAAAGVNHVLGGVAGPRGGQRGVGGPGGYPGHHRAGSARSWHPSPFASDDEIAHEAAAAAASDEPQFYKVNINTKQAFLLTPTTILLAES